eukprot:jgi/Botrbrau1/15628/Bobra.4_1s0013.3
MRRSWPRIYADLFKYFQASLAPSPSELAGGLWTPTFETKRESFRFAVGVSSNPVLSLAIVECVAAIKSKLGFDVRPDFCSLVVSTEPYGSMVGYAPAFVQEILTPQAAKPPVLIGGAVQELLCLGPSKTVTLSGEGWSPRNGQGVSLMAACLPGVSLYPFHATSPSLPALPPEVWDELARDSHGFDLATNSAGFLLSEPHFTQVDEFVSRLQNVLPNTPIVGGVVEPKGWGRLPLAVQHNSLRGALFLGNKALDEGAVGCIMKGPLQLDTIATQGCRPVGGIHKVTQARGNMILRIDDTPSLIMLHRLHKGLKKHDKVLPVHLGIRPPGFPGFVMRNIDSISEENMAVRLAASEVVVGSLLQLHVRDSDWGKEQLESMLKVLPQVLLFQRVLSQGLVSQGVLSQGLVSQGMVSQGLVSQGVPSQGLVSQGLSSQGLVCQGLVSQGLLSQELVS